MDTYADWSPEDAILKLIGELGAESGMDVVDRLRDSAGEADLAWREILEGNPQTSSSGVGSVGQSSGQRITPIDGEADVEHPVASSRSSSLKIQKMLLVHMDRGLHESLVSGMEAAGDWTGVTRMRELSCDTLDHT